MAVLIRDPEADRLIRQLADRCNETITEAVRTAVRQRLASLPPKGGRVDRAKIAAAQAYFDGLPRANAHLTDDQIVGYNDDGHFD